MASIVVVGGGAAGLVCAWRLQRAGHSVEVLEYESSLGGRVRTERIDTRVGEFSVPHGCSFFTSGQRNVASVLTALGIEDAVRGLETGGPSSATRGGVQAVGSVPGGVIRGRSIDACDVGKRLGFARSRGLSPRARLRLGRLAAEVVRRRDRLDPLDPERAARLEGGEELLEYTERMVGEVARDRLIGPMLETLLGCDWADVSPAFLLLTLTSLRHGAAPQALDGGLERLIAGLAKDVVVRTGCEVFSVETEQGGARVGYRASDREQSVVADACVIAVPAPLVPILCPKLTPDERGFFAAVRYAPAMTVELLLARAPARPLPFATGFARGDSSGLRSVLQSHRAPGVAPEGAGLLSVSLGGEAIRRLANARDEEIADFAIDALADTVFGAVSPLEVRVDRVHDARPVFPRGALSRLENFGVRIDRSPRVAFAGDYMIAPTLEGALTSGMQAAWRIVQSLEATAWAQRPSAART